MKMIGRATNPEVLTASTQASFRNTGASDTLRYPASASGLLIRLVAVVEEDGVAVGVAEPRPMADA